MCINAWIVGRTRGNVHHCPHRSDLAANRWLELRRSQDQATIHFRAPGEFLGQFMGESAMKGQPLAPSPRNPGSIVSRDTEGMSMLAR